MNLFGPTLYLQSVGRYSQINRSDDFKNSGQSTESLQIGRIVLHDNTVNETFEIASSNLRNIDQVPGIFQSVTV